MPKPMTITVGVEEAYFGKIYRSLDTTPGVVSLSYHSEHKTEGKPNGKVNLKYETSAKALVLDTLSKAKGPLPASAIVEAFRKASRADGSASSTLHVLKTGGLITQSRKGYALSSRGRKAISK